MRLTNEEVIRLHEERNRILAFCQDLREMAEGGTYWFRAAAYGAADEFHAACMMIDDVIREGSAEGQE